MEKYILVSSTVLFSEIILVSSSFYCFFLHKITYEIQIRKKKRLNQFYLGCIRKLYELYENELYSLVDWNLIYKVDGSLVEVGLVVL